jgi:hypothetical protein
MTTSLQEFIALIIRGGCALLIVSALGLNGCATVGPKSIAAGRGVYTEVINRTDDEQILNVLVRMRYEETFGMMSVASVTANLRFTTRAGAQFGVGNSDNFAGNLVPLSAGVAYEENPTISYVPLNGEDFMRRMISPISMREWILLAGPAKDEGLVLEVGMRRINGLRNTVPGQKPRSPSFTRFVELYSSLRQDAVLDVAKAADSAKGGDYFWDIHDYADTHDDSVREFLDLLGIELEPDGSPIFLRLLESIGPSTTAVHVQPRSAYDVLRVFEAGIEIPSVHLEAGIAEPLKSPVSKLRRLFTVRSSAKRPENATVQILFRDHWFYIDATDTDSKRAFSFLRTFIGMRLADPGAAQRAPILTVPVN